MMERNKKSRFRFLAGMFALSLGWAGASAQAELVQIAQKHDLGTLQTQVTPMSTASFDKFDPTLGTLESVTIELSNVSMSSEIFAEYGGRGSTTVTDTINGTATLQVPASLLPAGVSGTISPTFALAYSQVMASSGDNFDITRTLDQTSPASALSLTFSGSQAQGFVGSGTFSLLFSANASAVLTNTNGSGSRGTLTFVTGTPVVVYTYSAVKTIPEPASLWLLAVGGLVLPALAAARHRAARA